MRNLMKKPARYVFVIGSLKKGGAERNIAKVASALCAMNHPVYLILFEKQIDYALHPGVNIVDLNIARYKNSIIKLLGLYLSLTWHVWSIAPKYAISFTRLSSQFLVTTFYPRVIVRYDTYPFFFKKRKWITSLILFNFPNVRYVICPSAELKERMKKFFIRKRKLTVVFNPVAQIADAGEPFTPPARPYFIIVGRLRTQKQINTALDAFAQTRARHDYDLRILGEGPEEKKLRAQVEKLGLQQQVNFMGFVSNPYPLVRHARGLILSSNKEGFPNVLVEALSLGTPVVASDCLTGPKEIVTEGVNGYLFPVGDAPRLAMLIDTLAYDDDAYRKLKEESVTSVAKFDGEIIFKRWLEVLH